MGTYRAAYEALGRAGAKQMDTIMVAVADLMLAGEGDELEAMVLEMAEEAKDKRSLAAEARGKGQSEATDSDPGWAAVEAYRRMEWDAMEEHKHPDDRVAFDPDLSVRDSAYDRDAAYESMVAEHSEAWRDVPPGVDA